MIIKKKIWPEYFPLVQSEKKKFELRVNDFDVNEGDTLILEEWDPKTKEYTGRKIEKKVGYVLKFKLDDFGYLGVFETRVLAQANNQEARSSARFALQTWTPDDSSISTDGYVYPLVP